LKHNPFLDLSQLSKLQTKRKKEFVVNKLQSRQKKSRNYYEFT
jgi:hypothetical protein